MKGRKLDIEPERDAKNYIDFEHLPSKWDGNDEADNVRHLYHVGAFWTILDDNDVERTQGTLDKADILRTLVKVLDSDGEVEAYELLASVLSVAGYDTYNSDTRFEVYEKVKPYQPLDYDDWAQYTSFWANCDRCGELHVLDDLGIVDTRVICDKCWEE